MLEFEVDSKKVLDEILDKQKSFETRMSPLLQEFDGYANIYRLISTQQESSNKLVTSGLSNTKVSATTRAVETLSTMQYAMMTAQSPNFETIPMRPDIDERNLFGITNILDFQNELIEQNRKLLKGLRTLNLMGTTFFEEPWVTFPSHEMSPIWEATDFVPRSLSQVGFAPNALDLAEADWIYTLDFVSPYRLKKLANMDELGDTWNQKALGEAIESSKDSDYVPAEVKSRLSMAGYSGDTKNNLELLTYWGPLESHNIMDDYVVGIVNRRYVVRLHKSPFLSGLRPFKSAHFIEFELEPYGYGVGRLTKRIQQDLDANRNRIQNIVTFALFHMWKMSRNAGIKPSNLKIRPWHVVELDDMAGLEPIRPDLNAIQFGFKLEEVLKDDFETVTGATKNLQAMTTEATATEARITQAEAVRRISVMTEIIADRLLRQHLKFSHKNNMQFLDKDIWLMFSGDPKPQRISPVDIQKKVDFKLRLTTDKDFRPKRAQNIIQYLQILSSLRNFIPDEIDYKPVIFEIAREFGIDPRAMLKQKPAGDEDVLRKLTQLRAMGGLVNKEAQMDNAGEPGNLPIQPGGLNGIAQAAMGL